MPPSSEDSPHPSLRTEGAGMDGGTAAQGVEEGWSGKEKRDGGEWKRGVGEGWSGERKKGWGRVEEG